MDIFTKFSIPQPIMFGTGIVLEAMTQIFVTDESTLEYRSFLIDNRPGKNDEVVHFAKTITNRKGEVIKVDHDSFSILTPSFFADKNLVYGVEYNLKKRVVTLTPIKGVLQDTFQSVGLYYSTDGVNSYFAPTGKIIKNDVVRVMCDDQIGYTLDEAQLRSIQIHNFWQSQIVLGQQEVYFRGQKISDSDAATFKKIEAVQASVYKDSKQIYIEDSSRANSDLLPLPSIDLKTFICVNLGKKPGTHRSIQYCGDKQGSIFWHVEKLSSKKDKSSLKDIAPRHKDFFESQKDNPTYKDFWYWH